MNRTDPFFLESRPLLIASREILDSFLQRLADESIDISELHLGYAEDAATLAYGTATRFYLLARKQLRAERGCSEARSQAVERLCAVGGLPQVGHHSEAAASHALLCLVWHAQNCWEFESQPRT